MGSAAQLSRLAADIMSVNRKLDIIMEDLGVRDHSPTGEKSSKTIEKTARYGSTHLLEWWKEESTNPDWEKDRS